MTDLSHPLLRPPGPAPLLSPADRAEAGRQQVRAMARRVRARYWGERLPDDDMVLAELLDFALACAAGDLIRGDAVILPHLGELEAWDLGGLPGRGGVVYRADGELLDGRVTDWHGEQEDPLP